MQQSVINAAADQWRIRLKACVKANGKQFEIRFVSGLT